MVIVLQKDSNRRHLQKQSEDLEKLVTPDMVSMFENSDSARKAVAYIGQFSGAQSLQINQSICTVVVSCLDVLLPVITTIVNSSLLHGHFPSNLEGSNCDSYSEES